MTPTTIQQPADPYANLLAKLGQQLPAIQAKLPADHWEPFKHKLDAALDVFKTAKNDKGRNQAIEQIRKLTHYPQDWFLVGEIQVGVFKGTPFESSSHPVSNPTGSQAAIDLQQQLIELLSQYPEGAKALADIVIKTTHINSGGGTVVAGDISVGNDFVGGDKISGNKINIENLTIVQGDRQKEAETKSIAEAAAEIRKEEIRLDVAYPNEGTVGVPFMLAVAVLQPEAPQLQIEDLEHIESGTGTIFRAANQQLVKYKIKVEAPGCVVQPEEIVVQLQSGQNSPIVRFFITAPSEGKKQIMIIAYQDSELFIAQTLVHIDIAVAVAASEPINPTSLRERMEEWLSLVDLKTVCFEMGVEYDNLTGGKDERIIGLIQYCQQRGRLDELITGLEKVNTERSWR